MNRSSSTFLFRCVLAVSMLGAFVFVMAASWEKRDVSVISQDYSATLANADSRHPSISADGRQVAFRSEATNLVPGDANGVEDIFVKNVETGAITRVSTDASGQEGNGESNEPFISADGLGDGPSVKPALAEKANRIALESKAANLAAPDTGDSLPLVC